MNGLNTNWNCCRLVRSDRNFNYKEVNDVFQNALTFKANEAMSKIKKGGFGAVASDDDTVSDGFFLVKWTTNTYILQEPTKVFGIEAEMPTGTVVVEGTIFNRIHQNPGWYQPPDYTGPNMATDLFWIQHVVKGELATRSSIPDGPRKMWPPKPSHISEHNRTFNRTGLKRLYSSQIHYIRTEIESREKLELLVDDDDDDTDDAAQLHPPQSETACSFSDNNNISSEEGDDDNDDDYRP